MPYVEYPLTFSDSPLISELLVPALKPDAEGWIDVPERPGLGFGLNQDLLKRYRVAPS